MAHPHGCPAGGRKWVKKKKVRGLIRPFQEYRDEVDPLPIIQGQDWHSKMAN
jgi:hypothetical protein